jgi:hypothetical protein
MRLACRVVRSPPGKPLRLPDDFRAGSTFPLTFLGKTGTARITAEPDAQHPLEAKKLGAMFYAHWTTTA